MSHSSGNGDSSLSRRACAPRVVSTGHTIIGQGDESNGKFYIIAKGKVLVEKDAEHIATLSKGDFFGERALLSGGRRNSACIALKSVMLFTLDKEAFDRVKDFGQARSQILTRILISVRPSKRMKFPRLPFARVISDLIQRILISVRPSIRMKFPRLHLVRY